MGIFTRVGQEPAGANAAGLPKFQALMSLVPGYTHLWYLSDEAVGEARATWATKAGVASTLESGTTQPVVVASSVGGVKAWAFTGTQGLLKREANPFAAEQRTLVLLARITAADGENTTLFGEYGDDVQMVRNASNQLGIFAPGTGAAVSTSTVTGSEWHTFGLVLGETTATGWRDGTQLVSVASSGRGTMNGRFPIAGGVFGKCEIAAIVTYPTALSSADMGTLHANLRAAYPGASLP